ncbi:MAG: preprotein translocase subunit SecG [Ferruginibacter sp.]
MLALFGVLIIIASIILGLIVLIQNPKGGGISGSLTGFSTQFIGVKQTTDILEKGTWVFAAIVGILCMISPAFIPKEGAGDGNDLLKGAPVSSPAKPAAQPSNTVPLPAPASTPNK